MKTWKEYLEKLYEVIDGIKEDAPANSAGSGNIAGIGVGPAGEPGIRPQARKRYKDKNKEDSAKRQLDFVNFVKRLGENYNISFSRGYSIGPSDQALSPIASMDSGDLQTAPSQNVYPHQIAANYRTQGVSTYKPFLTAKKQQYETWSQKYKDSIDCNNPKGFSQKAHCQGRKKKD